MEFGSKDFKLWFSGGCCCRVRLGTIFWRSRDLKGIELVGPIKKLEFYKTQMTDSFDKFTMIDFKGNNLERHPKEIIKKKHAIFEVLKGIGRSLTPLGAQYRLTALIDLHQLEPFSVAWYWSRKSHAIWNFAGSCSLLQLSYSKHRFSTHLRCLGGSWSTDYVHLLSRSLRFRLFRGFLYWPDCFCLQIGDRLCLHCRAKKERKLNESETWILNIYFLI